MAKDIREQLQEILSSNTFVARLIDGADVKGLPGNKIDILMDDELTMSSYIQVPVLPLPQDAKEGVFYILPNSSINYIIDGQWESVFPTDEVIKKVKKADGTVLPVDTTDMSVTLPQDDLSDGFYFTTANLKIEPGDTQQVAISDIADFSKDNLVIGETTLFDADGTMAVVISLVNTSTVQTKTMTAVGIGATAKSFTANTYELVAAIGGATNVPVSDLDGYDANACKIGTSFVTDKNGRLGLVTSKSATTVAVRTINNITHSGHVMYTTDTINNKRNAESTIDFYTFDYTIEEAGLLPFIPNKTIVYDQHGTLAKVTSVDEANHTVTATTFLSIEWAGEAFHHSQLTGEVGESVEVLVSDLDAYDDDLCIPYRSFVYDNYGRIGIVTSKTVSKVTITILTSPSSYKEYDMYLMYNPPAGVAPISKTPLAQTTISLDYVMGFKPELIGRDYKWVVYDAEGTLALVVATEGVGSDMIMVQTLTSSYMSNDRMYFFNDNVTASGEPARMLESVDIGQIFPSCPVNRMVDGNGVSWDPFVNPEKYIKGKTLCYTSRGVIGVIENWSQSGGFKTFAVRRLTGTAHATYGFASEKLAEAGGKTVTTTFPSEDMPGYDNTLVFGPQNSALGCYKLFDSITNKPQIQTLVKFFTAYRMTAGNYLSTTLGMNTLVNLGQLDYWNGTSWEVPNRDAIYTHAGLIYDGNGSIGVVADASGSGDLVVKTISLSPPQTDIMKPNTWSTSRVIDFGNGAYGARFTGSHTFTAEELNIQGLYSGKIATLTPLIGSYGNSKVMSWGGTVMELNTTNEISQRGLIFGADYNKVGNNFPTETAALTFKTTTAAGNGEFELWYNGFEEVNRTLKWDIWFTFYKGTL